MDAAFFPVKPGSRLFFAKQPKLRVRCGLRRQKAALQIDGMPFQRTTVLPVKFKIPPSIPRFPRFKSTSSRSAPYTATLFLWKERTQFFKRRFTWNNSRIPPTAASGAVHLAISTRRFGMGSGYPIPYMQRVINAESSNASPDRRKPATPRKNGMANAEALKIHLPLSLICSPPAISRFLIGQTEDILLDNVNIRRILCPGCQIVPRLTQ